MEVTYRFCIVDPGTWRDVREIDTVEDAEITFDLELETRGSMTMKVGEDVGEAYIRAYMVLDGVSCCVGTFLAQTQQKDSSGRKTTDGKPIARWDVDAYTPLLELKDDLPDIGFSTVGGTVLAKASALAAEHMRAPVAASGRGSLITKAIVAKDDDTWLSYISGILEKDGHRIMVEPDGTATFAPVRDVRAMQPVFSFDDGNASIVEPDVSETRDLYGVPNIVEVVASDGDRAVVARSVNDDPDSPASLVARGRPVKYRETSPALPDGFSDDDVADYAERLRTELSSVTRTIEFTHGWIPNVSIGDCVRLDFERYGIHTPAVVQSQKISCNTRAEVRCVATYTEVI